MPTTGQLIRKARLEAKLSQNQLARELDCTGFLVSHWEADRKPVTDMESLAKALGTTVEAITGDTPAAPKRIDPIALPMAPLENVEPWLTVSQARHVLEEFLGRRFYHAQIHTWIQTHGLPAYENPLKRNCKNEPTLLLKRSEILAWLNRTFRPVSVCK